jgi:hypothetical protein
VREAPRLLGQRSDTVQIESSGLELEIIDEHPNGETTYSRAYSVEAARILAQMRMPKNDVENGDEDG